MSDLPVPSVFSPGLPPGMDAMAVGRSVFGAPRLPVSPVVAGYSAVTWMAEGGFGTVWRAREDASAREVALKVPHCTDPETIERMEAEAGALKALDHPNIVSLYDIIASVDDIPVLVMELVDGPPLNARLPAGGFDFDEALQIFLPVLDAVSHAHASGIVHLDLKPGNILLTSGNVPKVTDFGLAQPLDGRRVNFALTRSGVVAGTVEYLAPERYDPQTGNGAAADIFALGIILYELLTGRPPRGAWQPPSSLKRLDVRLDALILEAIHPDPLKRLVRPGALRKRLEEIRHTRPRYAGTPLVTRRVRMADAVWTVAGLYCFAAAFCALLRVNHTAVPGLFDLSFGHTYLLGGFWALWVLTAAMAGLWLWQMARLWHFRRVPLREALPAPLGLCPGRSRGAAVVVAFTQLCCLWGPLIYTGWLWSQVWYWAGASTPPWDRVLAITRWGSETPVSMWTWEPAGFFSGDEFWIREMQPGYPGESWQLHDRQSFLVVTMPLIMVLGMAMIGAGILFTAMMTIVEWKGRSRGLLIVFLASLAGAGWYQWRVVLEEQALHARHLLYDRPEAESDRRMRTAFPRLRKLLTHVFSSAEGPPFFVENDFAPRVFTGGDSAVPRKEFVSALRAEQEWNRSARLTAEEIRFKVCGPAPGKSTLEFTCETYTSPGGEPASGAWVNIIVSCRDENLDGWVVSWEKKTTPLYLAEEHTMEISAAVTWLRQFLDCLLLPGCPGLEEFFLPVTLAPNSDAPRHDIPVPREVVASVLRHRVISGQWNLQPLSVPRMRRLPGARNELLCDLQDGEGRPLHWRMELIFTDGSWKALRLRM